jgi:uncharacterized glyoxalase superfamily protein PhnB
MTILWPTLTVRDVDASLAFYSGHLGFRQDLAEKDDAGTTFLGSVEVGETVIMFEGARPGGPLEPDHGLTSGVVLTVCLRSTDELEALYLRLQASAVNICGPIGNRPWGNRDFMIQDPDGYRIVVASQIQAT